MSDHPLVATGRSASGGGRPPARRLSASSRDAGCGRTPEGNGSPMAELSAAASAGVVASERDVLLATKLYVPG
ncbi:MAG: hypothetical protein WA484_10830, partial [Solirubrobacteraceae bacterium]